MAKDLKLVQLHRVTGKEVLQMMLEDAPDEVVVIGWTGDEFSFATNAPDGGKVLWSLMQAQQALLGGELD